MPFLAKNIKYTMRFAMRIGRMCESQSIKSVAEEFNLDWKTVKDLDTIYMKEKLDRSPDIKPKVIGIDEISIKKGHQYRIVVSDLIEGRPIWFGGVDRSQESMDMFFKFLGVQKTEKIRLSVMDMWKPFENSTLFHAKNSAIMYDRFHVVMHLNEAMDKIRRSEYNRLDAKQAKYIKGQRYNLLTKKENLSLDAKASLKELLRRNKRLNRAYILKEQFEMLWTYRKPKNARRFFDSWKDSLKWARLKPFEKFAAMVERHWDGIVAYCAFRDRKIKLGYVEGMNNKIRVLQRRAYGLRDEEYLGLKILTSALPKLKSG
jgi:transposase